MRKNTKKGFTLVELVIVIAVIAVLSAIIIPVTSSIVQNAKETVDKTTVRALNDALTQDEAKNGKRTLYSDVVNAMQDYGYGVEKLTPLSLGDILWDSVNNTFILKKDGKEVMRQKGSSTGVKDVDLWMVAKSVADVEGKPYSKYLASGYDFGDTISNLHTGLDVGENSVNVNYSNTNEQTVIINTNGGFLTIDAANDTVNHYGSAGYVEIKQIASHSYHEFGAVNAVSVSNGHFVAESTAKVVRVHAASASASLKEVEGAMVINYTKDASITNVTVEGIEQSEISNGAAIDSDSAAKVNVSTKGGVAELNGMHFADLQSAFDVAKDGETVKLLDNFVINKAAVIEGKKITLDMNGKTISNVTDIWSDSDWSLVSARKGAELTITGDGALKAKSNDCYAVDIQDGSKCTIENGTFTGNIHAVYVIEGELTVKGGHYSIQQKYPDASKADEFVLNCYDANYAAGTAKITVTGGTFERFNPADCKAEGVNSNFVAAGYTVESSVIPSTEDLQYTVVKAN